MAIKKKKPPVLQTLADQGLVGGNQLLLTRERALRQDQLQRQRSRGGVSAPTPQKGEDATRFIQRREKIAAQLAEAAGRSGVGPGKNITAQAVALASQEEAARGRQVTVQEAQAQQAKLAAAAGQVGKVPGIQPGSEAFINQLDTGEIIAGTLGDVATGAGAGAGLGLLAAPFTAGASIPTGAAIGALAGIVTGVIRNVRSEGRQSVREQVVTLSSSRRNVKGIINAVNLGLIDPMEGVQLYNAEILKIQIAESKLKTATQDDLAKWLSDGEDDLIRLQAFSAGEKPIYDAKMQEAILMPNAQSPMLSMEIEDFEGEIE